MDVWFIYHIINSSLLTGYVTKSVGGFVYTLTVQHWGECNPEALTLNVYMNNKIMNKNDVIYVKN